MIRMNNACRNECLGFGLVVVIINLHAVEQYGWIATEDGSGYYQGIIIGLLD